MSAMELYQILDITRQAKNITLLELVGKTKLSYGMVYRILNGSVKKPKPNILKLLAHHLELNYTSLLEKAGYDISGTSINTTIFSIPLLDWNFLQNLIPVSTDIHGSLTDQRLLVPDNQKHCFSVQLNTNSFAPHFLSSHVLICSKNITPSAKETMLYFDKLTGALSIGVLHQLPDGLYLSSLDPRCPQKPRHLDSSSFFMAKVVECRVNG